jgi:hypothetical protein
MNAKHWTQKTGSKNIYKTLMMMHGASLSSLLMQTKAMRRCYVSRMPKLVSFCYPSHQTSSILGPVQCHQSWVYVDISAVKRDRLSISRDHIRCTNSCKAVNVDVGNRALETEDIVLAVLGSAAIGTCFDLLVHGSYYRIP